jgi:oligoribonuclease NrnB/cAMP/cGMP phosphodiesterase (DHH superfamily)
MLSKVIPKTLLTIISQSKMLLLEFFLLNLKMDLKLVSDQKEVFLLTNWQMNLSGGGHTNAAGARFFTNNMQEMIPVIISKARTLS